MQRIVKATWRPPAISGRDPKGGLPRLSDVVAPVLRCPSIAIHGHRRDGRA